MDRGSQLSKDDEDDEEDEEEEERRTRQEEERRTRQEEAEEEEEEEDEEATDIKSNNPHLAGGEQRLTLVHEPSMPRGIFQVTTRGYLNIFPLYSHDIPITFTCECSYYSHIIQYVP